MNHSNTLVQTLMSLPIFEAEWVLWLLIGLSLASVAVMVERVIFYFRHKVDADAVRMKLDQFLGEGDFEGAASYLAQFDALETNVALFGLRGYAARLGRLASLRMLVAAIAPFAMAGSLALAGPWITLGLTAALALVALALMAAVPWRVTS